jgi:DNA-binding GntR family transcriptional regulator
VSPYDELKNAILSGEFEPGYPLVETVLAERYGVSRTPIREALRRLQQDGLIDRNERGLGVRQRSPEEIIDIYETRMVLEALAARAAAERRMSHDLRSLELWIERGAEVADTDAAGMTAVNQQFHWAVWRAAHNESLIDLLERLNLHLARYPGTTLASPGRWDSARAEHRRLAEAIERRDGDGAYDVALHHFTAARDIRLALFKEETRIPGDDQALF